MSCRKAIWENDTVKLYGNAIRLLSHTEKPYGKNHTGKSYRNVLKCKPYGQLRCHGSLQMAEWARKHWVGISFCTNSVYSSKKIKHTERERRHHDGNTAELALVSGQANTERWPFVVHMSFPDR